MDWISGPWGPLRRSSQRPPQKIWSAEWWMDGGWSVSLLNQIQRTIPQWMRMSERRTWCGRDMQIFIGTRSLWTPFVYPGDSVIRWNGDPYRKYRAKSSSIFFLSLKYWHDNLSHSQWRRDSRSSGTLESSTFSGITFRSHNTAEPRCENKKVYKYNA